MEAWQRVRRDLRESGRGSLRAGKGTRGAERSSNDKGPAPFADVDADEAPRGRATVGGSTGADRALTTLRVARARAHRAHGRMRLLARALVLAPALLAPAALAALWFTWTKGSGGDLFIQVVMTLGALGALFCSISPLTALAEFDDDECDELLLRRDDLPGVFAVLDDLCRTVGTPPIDAVAILPHANAYAAVMPDPAARGAPIRVLGIGAPLLVLLSPERSFAVIAHELAHFAHDDVGSHEWTGRADHVYRLMLPILGFSCVFCPLLVPAGVAFYGFQRLLHVAAARTSRTCEHAADAFAAAIAGEAAATDALVLLHTLGGDAQEEAWRPLNEAFEEGHGLPHDLFGTLPRRLLSVYNEVRMAEMLEAGRGERAAVFDSHPDLAARVRALGRPLDLPVIDPGKGSWESFMGRALEPTVERLEGRLRAQLGHTFDERARDVSETRPVIARAVAEVDDAPDPAEAAEVAALLMERSMPLAEARPTLEEWYRRFEDRAEADGRVIAAVPTARAMLLAKCLDDGDPRAVAPAAELLLHAPQMAGELCWRLDALMNGEVHADLRAAQAEAKGPAKKAIQRAFVAWNDMPDGDEVFEGKVSVGAHGIADWHAELVVREATEWLGTGGMRPLALHLARGTERYGGAPSFWMVIRSDRRLERPLKGQLSERVCLPGALGWFLSIGPDEEVDPRLQPILDAPGAQIHRAPETEWTTARFRAGTAGEAERKAA